MNRICKECKYYQNDSIISGGECRINPPQLIRGLSKWPHVKEEDWCGQFQPNYVLTGRVP